MPDVRQSPVFLMADVRQQGGHSMKPEMSIETSRLNLRRFSLYDVNDVQKMAGDHRVSRMTEAIPYPYKDGMAEDWISTHDQLWSKGTGAPFAVELKAHKKLIGCVGLSVTRRHKRAELGYWIGYEHWSNGYCTEAARAVLNYGFSILSLTRVEAIHLTKNPASGAVMRKLGMCHEGTMKSYVLRDGHHHDMERYAILDARTEI